MTSLHWISQVNVLGAVDVLDAKEQVSLFQTRAASLAQAASDRYADGSLDRAWNCAHKLKALASLVGAVPLSEACEALRSLKGAAAWSQGLKNLHEETQRALMGLAALGFLEDSPLAPLWCPHDSQWPLSKEQLTSLLTEAAAMLEALRPSLSSLSSDLPLDADALINVRHRLHKLAGACETLRAQRLGQRARKYAAQEVLGKSEYDDLEAVLRATFGALEASSTRAATSCNETTIETTIVHAAQPTLSKPRTLDGFSAPETPSTGKEVEDESAVKTQRCTRHEPFVCVGIDDDPVCRVLIQMVLQELSPDVSVTLGATRRELLCVVDMALGRCSVHMRPIPSSQQRAVDLMIIDQHLLSDDGHVILGTELAADLRAQGFEGIICILSSASRAELEILEAHPAVDLARGKGQVTSELTTELKRHLAARKKGQQFSSDGRGNGGIARGSCGGGANSASGCGRGDCSSSGGIGGGGIGGSSGGCSGDIVGGSGGSGGCGHDLHVRADKLTHEDCYAAPLQHLLSDSDYLASSAKRELDGKRDDEIVEDELSIPVNVNVNVNELSIPVKLMHQLLDSLQESLLGFEAHGLSWAHGAEHIHRLSGAAAVLGHYELVHAARQLEAVPTRESLQAVHNALDSLRLASRVDQALPFVPTSANTCVSCHEPLLCDGRSWRLQLSCSHCCHFVCMLKSVELGHHACPLCTMPLGSLHRVHSDEALEELVPAQLRCVGLSADPLWRSLHGHTFALLDVDAICLGETEEETESFVEVAAGLGKSTPWRPADAVLLDSHVGTDSAAELAVKLRAAHFQGVICVLTALPREACHALEASVPEIDLVLRKGIPPRLLGARLRLCLAAKRQARAAESKRGPSAPSESSDHVQEARATSALAEPAAKAIDVEYRNDVELTSDVALATPLILGRGDQSSATVVEAIRLHPRDELLPKPSEASVPMRLQEIFKVTVEALDINTGKTWETVRSTLLPALEEALLAEHHSRYEKGVHKLYTLVQVHGQLEPKRSYSMARSYVDEMGSEIPEGLRNSVRRHVETRVLAFGAVLRVVTGGFLLSSQKLPELLDEFRWERGTERESMHTLLAELLNAVTTFRVDETHVLVSTEDLRGGLERAREHLCRASQSILTAHGQALPTEITKRVKEGIESVCAASLARSLAPERTSPEASGGAQHISADAARNPLSKAAAKVVARRPISPPASDAQGGRCASGSSEMADADGRMLWSACQHGKVAFIRQLMNSGVEINTPVEHSRESALHIAVQYGQLKVVQCLLNHPAIDPNAIAPYAGTPLHLAAHKGDKKMVALLLTHKAVDPNIVNEELARMTPLMFAVQQGNMGVLKLLLRHKAIQVNMLSSIGFSALHMAAYSAPLDVLQCLLQHPDILVDLPAHNGTRPLQVAMSEGREDAIQLLLEAGAAPCCIVD